MLVWSTYLYSKKNLSFTPAAWREVLVNTEKDSETSLTQIETKAKTKIEEFDKNYASEKADKDGFEFSQICMKDITEEDAYLYVRGHELFDHLLNSVLNPIISSLRNCHYSTLRSSGIDASSQKAALQEYCKKDKSVKSLLSKNYRYKDNTPIYEKIKVDVSQIWD